MRILLVDDHPLIHDALARILAAQGDTVVHESATSFELGCHRLAQLPPIDLVLLDLGLPGFEGVSALTELRIRFPDVSVVVVSAQEDAETIQLALDGGAMGFVPKSFKPAAIKSALRFVAAGGVFVPQQAIGASGEPPAASKPDNTTDMPASDERVRERMGLTPRQFDVLKLLVRGMTNKRIAEEMHLSDNTIKAHVAALLRALAAANRTEAVVLASRYGLRAMP